MEGGRDPFFGSGNPFGSFSGFGGQRSLLSSFFGGNDPFDDPFFTRPFGSMFESSLFGSNSSPFLDSRAPAFIEHQPPRPNRSRGPVIEELNSDDENEGKESRPVIEELNSDDENERKESEKDKMDNPRKHRRSIKEPLVEDPDDEAAEKKSKQMTPKNDIHLMQNLRPRTQTSSFTFQSSTVSYGGADGAYYTSSRTRRAGSDGLTMEERKEANSATRQASHMLSRGIHDKGHTMARKLNSDGRVDTMQTLHNLNEDELVGFDEAWKGKTRQCPGWSEGFGMQGIMGSGSQGQHEPNRGGWALPSNQSSNNTGSTNPYMGHALGPRSQHSTHGSNYIGSPNLNMGHGIGPRSQQSARMKEDIGSSRGRSRVPGTSGVHQATKR